MLPGNRNIFNDIREVVCLIPTGRVSSYGAIARYLGLKSARTVGWALAGLAGQSHVPAHRVVNSKGVLTGAGAFDANESMHEKLASEGIKIQKNQIEQFPKVFWDPSLEL